MHKVISINLNGNAYQLDEDAYFVLKAYLDHAEVALRQNPDKAEILADLEQALGEKCSRYLGPQKTVVVKLEVDQIILEMGPVEAAESADTGRSKYHDERDSKSDAAKRLYRIREGAMLAGVCTGLAAYLHVDVTIVRIAFVLAAFFTSGVAMLAYFVMMLVVPEANTSDEHAAAHGLPFNAQELVDRAKSFAKSSDEWRRHWRRRQREFRREWRREWRRETAGAAPYWRATDIPASIFAGVMTPIFGMMTLAIFVVFLFVVHMLATTGQVGGWTIPPGMPFWVTTLILFGVFLLITSPLSAARHLSHRAYGHYPTFAIWSGIMWLTLVVGASWLASQHQSEIRDFLQNLPLMWRDVLLRLQQ